MYTHPPYLELCPEVSRAGSLDVGLLLFTDQPEVGPHAGDAMTHYQAATVVHFADQSNCKRQFVRSGGVNGLGMSSAGVWMRTLWIRSSGLLHLARSCEMATRSYVFAWPSLTNRSHSSSGYNPGQKLDLLLGLP